MDLTYVRFSGSRRRVVQDVYQLEKQLLSGYGTPQLQYQHGVGVGDISAVSEDDTRPLDFKLSVDVQLVAVSDVARRCESVADFRDCTATQRKAD